MGLLSSILEIFAVWANGTFIEMQCRLLHVTDDRPEIGSRPVGMDLFEAGTICLNLRPFHPGACSPESFRGSGLRLVFLCVLCVLLRLILSVLGYETVFS